MILFKSITGVPFNLCFVTTKAECYLSNIASIPKSDSNPDTPAFPSIVSVLH